VKTMTAMLVTTSLATTSLVTTTALPMRRHR
jgi:hypothetical protein